MQLSRADLRQLINQLINEENIPMLQKSYRDLNQYKYKIIQSKPQEKSLKSYVSGQQTKVADYYPQTLDDIFVDHHILVPSAVIRMWVSFNKALGEKEANDMILTWLNDSRPIGVDGEIIDFEFLESVDMGMTDNATQEVPLVMVEQKKTLHDVTPNLIPETVMRQMIRAALLKEGRAEFNQALMDKAAEVEWKPGSYLPQDPTDWVDMKKHSRLIKDLFRQHADQSFIQNLITIHWGAPEKLAHVASASSKDEISVSAYLPGQITKGAFGSVGLVAKGYVTLLANSMDFLYTRGGQTYRKAHPERTAQSGANKGVSVIKPAEEYTKTSKLGLVLDESDWSPSTSLTGKAYNEALVDNWTPVAFIDATPTNKMIRWAASKMGGGENITNEVQSLAQELGIAYVTLAEANQMAPGDWASLGK